MPVKLSSSPVGSSGPGALCTLASLQYVQSRTTHFRTGYQFHTTSNSFEFYAFGCIRSGTTSMGTLCCDWAKPESCSQQLVAATQLGDKAQ
ncbi:hypothetical protein NPX13_g8169 [Xylaria arbuscula]|uniref:Uncharacterized protein n=1 Tax=Xylaria arbuscula TaxID=114810 RepID=A0A9W8N966_9PEZI|nr:hypothetical protein NPX13_g8169 [Xylaria arbuscula]